METSEVKSFLHKSIEVIEDNNFLNALKTMIETEYSPNVNNKLSLYQEKRIEESIQQIETKNYKTQDQVIEDIQKWLKQ